jgi:seryl-tRNA synthetase
MHKLNFIKEMKFFPYAKLEAKEFRSQKERQGPIDYWTSNLQNIYDEMAKNNRHKEAAQLCNDVIVNLDSIWKQDVWEHQNHEDNLNRRKDELQQLKCDEKKHQLQERINKLGAEKDEFQKAIQKLEGQIHDWESNLQKIQSRYH